MSEENKVKEFCPKKKQGFDANSLIENGSFVRSEMSLNLKYKGFPLYEVKI